MSCMFEIVKSAENCEKRVAGSSCMFALYLAAALSFGAQFVAAPAHAAPPLAAATPAPVDTPASLKVEAGGFFIPCSSVDATEARFCEGDQSIFAANYVCAFTGDYYSEQAVALSLSSSGSAAIRHVDILSCAWFRVLAEHNFRAADHDVLMMKGSCFFLTRTAQRLASARAAAFLARIKAFRATSGARSACR